MGHLNHSHPSIAARGRPAPKHHRGPLPVRPQPRPPVPFSERIVGGQKKGQSFDLSSFLRWRFTENLPKKWKDLKIGGDNHSLRWVESLSFRVGQLVSPFVVASLRWKGASCRPRSCRRRRSCINKAAVGIRLALAFTGKILP